MQKNLNSREIGNIGEQAVVDFLKSHGYEILKRNYTVRGGEIDIIAKKNEIIAFVEVKTRGKNPLVAGEKAITESKRRYIIRTAEHYLNTLEKSYDCRFDVAVVETEDRKILHLKYYVSAFDASK